MAQRQRYFNPWWIVLGSTLALIVCNGPVIGFTFGLFLKPVSQEFGWSRGAMSAASGAATLMMAMAVPFTGLLVDRFVAPPAHRRLVQHEGRWTERLRRRSALPARHLS